MKFSEDVRIAGTSSPAKYRERGSTGAAAVRSDSKRQLGARR
jgi:hypothetical protein